MPKVVVIGGSGVFGRRLARMIAAEGGFELIIAGRDADKAALAAKALGAAFMRLDREAVSSRQLLDLGCDIVIDCSGPFSLQGSAPYRVVEAALAAGAHYLDIADGRGFVCGIGQLDRMARAAGRFALTGASTTPALSSAVCDALTKNWSRVDAIEIGVTPGNRAPRGLAVVRSILSYAGRPVRVFREGAWWSAPGWGLLTRRSLSIDVKDRWLSLCDTADLELFPTRYRVRDRVIFRGGLELGVLHLGLTAASQLVRFGLVPSLSLFSDMARDFADTLIGFGTDRGGMIVEVKGLDAYGLPIERTWTLVAEGGDGPNIPILAAFACLKKLDSIAPGARPCMDEVSLPDFDALFRMFRIRTEIR